MTAPFEAGEPAAGPAARFEALASSVLGRPIRVVWAESGPTCTDGTVIELDPDQAHRARDAVLVQAALLASGALHPDRLRPLRHRPKRVAAYLRQAVPSAMEQQAAVLPPLAWPLTGEQDDAWWGTIRVARLLRSSVGPPPIDTATDVIGEPPATLDAEPEPGDDRRGERTATGRRTVDQGRRRRKGRTAERGPTSLGQAGIGRAVLATRPTPIPRVVGLGDARTVTVEPPGRPGAVTTYPEWDERRGTYRPDWCEVHELLAPTSSDGSAIDPASGALRRRLARVHLDLRTFRRQPQGGDLDLDAVIDHRISVRSGDATHDGVYRDLRRARRDLGVMVLLDGSGSTGRGVLDGLSVTERERAAALALTVAFEALGDRVACHVFRSHGRRRVELTELKSFDERVDGRARARLAAVRPEGFTRLGAAVRHGAHLLVERSGSRRWLLVVLSDGFPFDEGYEGAYAAADARAALAEARHRGVGALCLGVGATAPDHDLEAVFGAATYATGPTIEDLGADLAALVSAALDGADRSRRITRRN